MKHFSTLTACWLVICASGARAQNPGDFNLAFGNQGVATFNDPNDLNQAGRSIAVQSDGKILICGEQGDGNTSDFAVYRIHADGTFDYSFDSDGRVTYDLNALDVAVSVAVQNDGKILLLGNTGTAANGVDIALIRLMPNGALDLSFGTSGLVQLDRSGASDDFAVDMAIQPDGKIVIGAMMDILGDRYALVHRLLPNGDPDSSFSLDGSVFENSQLSELVLMDMDLADDGSIFLGGTDQSQSGYRLAVFKFTASGTLDNSFSADGIRYFSTGIGKEAALYGIAALPGGKLLCVGGELTTANQQVDALIVQLNASGLFDSDFNGNGKVLYDLSIGGDEYFLDVEPIAGGGFITAATVEMTDDEMVLAQFNDDGTFDINYGGGSGRTTLDIFAGDGNYGAFCMSNDFVFTLSTVLLNAQLDFAVTSTHVNNPVSLTETSAKVPALHLFPNPLSAGQTLWLELEDPKASTFEIELIDALGRTVKSQMATRSSNSAIPLDMSFLDPGMYSVRVRWSDKSAVQRVIVK